MRDERIKGAERDIDVVMPVSLPAAPSPRLRAAAAAERRRLARQLDSMQTRRRGLADELSRVDDEIADIEHRLAMLDAVAPGTDPRAEASVEASSEHGLVPLRGRLLRVAAVQTLLRRWQVDRPIHYREWYTLLQADGIAATGRHPIATFLTQIGRSPLVRHANTPGEYFVDSRVEARERERLHRLAEDLRSLHDGGAVGRELRERRRAITNEIERIERALEEAADSWDAASHGPDARAA